MIRNWSKRWFVDAASTRHGRMPWCNQRWQHEGQALMALMGHKIKIERMLQWGTCGWVRFTEHVFHQVNKEALETWIWRACLFCLKFRFFFRTVLSGVYLERQQMMMESGWIWWRLHVKHQPFARVESATPNDLAEAESVANDLHFVNSIQSKSNCTACIKLPYLNLNCFGDMPHV